jgi:hypothetical protein
MTHRGTEMRLYTPETYGQNGQSRRWVRASLELTEAQTEEHAASETTSKVLQATFSTSLQYAVVQEDGDFPGQAVLFPSNADLDALLSSSRGDNILESSVSSSRYPVTASPALSMSDAIFYANRQEEEVLIAEFTQDVVPVLIATGHWYASPDATREMLSNMANVSAALRSILCAMAAMYSCTRLMSIKLETTDEHAHRRSLAIHYFSQTLEALVKAVAPGDLPGECELAVMVMLIFWDMFSDDVSSDHRLHLSGARDMLCHVSDQESASSVSRPRQSATLMLDSCIRSLDVASSKWNACGPMLDSDPPRDLDCVIESMKQTRQAHTSLKASQYRHEIMQIQAEIGRLFDMTGDASADLNDVECLVEQVRKALEVWCTLLSGSAAEISVSCLTLQKRGLQLAHLQYWASVIYFFQAAGNHAVEPSVAQRAMSNIFQHLKVLLQTTHPRKIDLQALWPAFMAGTMALDESERSLALHILDHAATRGVACAQAARWVLVSVWQPVDDQGQFPTRNACWVFVSQQRGHKLLLP